ncbi:lasso RiPP family leader peptide-containing protein [Micromonospora sp. NPDC049645]
MNEKTMGYEPPALVEVGDFTDLTRITNAGEWSDLWGGWFDL